MKRDDFDSFCRSLKSTENVVQWGNASVWKIGGKIFAVGSSWGQDIEPENENKISFKCSDLSYSILTEQPGIIPAPYLARAKWVQIAEPDAMSEEDIRAYIEEAHRIIASKLTKAKRTELGL